MTLSGSFNGKGKRFGVVVSRFNELVTKSLLEGALDVLHRQGVLPKDIDTVWVPGAFEIPLAAKKLATKKGRPYDALIALGVIIRGETTHYEYVASSAASGLAQIGLEYNLPVAFGILTTETLDQALQRAGGKAGHKGRDAALSALEMADLARKI